uniref:Innexin n=1 Tax=Strigamia maritima TaxID=126957 RepID=T1IXN4_STRMM
MSALAALTTTFLKLKSNNSSARIDNLIFHLHYRITAVILTAAAILVTSTQHFGKAISCGPPPPSLTTDLLENYCWTRSTFSLQTPRTNDPYPGLNTLKDGDTILQHTYYQWVWLVLTLQAAMFYFPRYIWKKIENKRISRLVKGLTEPISDKQTTSVRISMLTQYVLRNWNNFNFSAFAYFMCEFLNFLNVIAQIYVIDVFLGGTFTTYGLRVLQYGFLEPEYRNDTLVVIFPRVTKCSFRAFGPSGGIQVHDAICVLPLNLLNEKIYVFLWFWLVFLAVPSALVLVYRILLFVCSPLRVKVLHWQYDSFRSRRLDRMVSGGKIGDWLFLNLLAKNVDELALDMLLDEFGKENEELSDDVKVRIPNSCEYCDGATVELLGQNLAESKRKRRFVGDKLLQGVHKVGDQVVLAKGEGGSRFESIYSGPYKVLQRLGANG